MISISGIEYQKELETLPYFNKEQAGMLIDKKGKNLDKKLAQLIKIGYLLHIKNGLYTTTTYYERNNKGSYSEYIANILRSPSYISLEYVLSKEGVIPEAVYSITSITVKSSRNYVNFLTHFLYKNIKNELFTGYSYREWENKHIYAASKAKALFDYLYLKKLQNLKQELLNDLRINWDTFERQDFLELQRYVEISKSKKMQLIVSILNTYVYR